MDLVCITDHDSIDGCLEYLDRHPDAPDFIAGEEISCLVPDAPGLRIHLGALGMTEASHREVQRLRDNVFDTAAFLRRERVFFVMNHLFMLFNDQLALDTYVRQALTLAPGLETRNGAMLAEHNEFVAELAASFRSAGVSPVAVGGSDAHLLRYVGTTYTETPAKTREQFMADLVEGRSTVGGGHGGRGRLLAEVYGSIANHWRSLVGLERHEITLPERAFSLVCSALLLPFQFIPAAIALRMKHNEDARIRRYRRSWAEEIDRSSLVTESPPL
jgi:hypothetical protein